MLLDVGEGSLGQLASLYKDEDLQDGKKTRPTLPSLFLSEALTENKMVPSFFDLRSVLLGLRAIWVSHPHADHHLGLMRVVTARRAVAKARALAQDEDEVKRIYVYT